MKQAMGQKHSLNRNKMISKAVHPLAVSLLDWFSKNGRQMPWRTIGGAHADAYAVWISEIMLQQTTVKTVVDYFNRWMERFPDIETLAAAPIEDVLHAWQGLGYYTRAKKIHECAGVLMRVYGGKIPADRAMLLKLPGIGPYSASSICAFAFNMPETVVDGNVIRVIARLYGLTHAVTKEEIYALAQPLVPAEHGADYSSAIMDLGACVCTPGNPDCSACPWREKCVAFQKRLTAEIPLIEKPVKQERSGTVFLIRNRAGAYYIRKRAGKGLLSGLYEFPWDYADTPPFEAKWQPLSRSVTHVFTHFKLTLKVVETVVDFMPMTDGLFVHPADFKDYAFSTLMKKVMKVGI